MKYIFLALTSVIILSCGQKQTAEVTQQIDSVIEITAIEQNLKFQKSAWNRGDIPGFMEYYWKNDSMAFMSKNDVRYGWQETLDAYKRNYPTQKEMGTLDFEIKKLEILSSESAYMLGAWNLERDTLDVGGYFSLIWKKIEGNWVIVTDHTS